MVKVTFILNKTEYIGLIVEGHANFAEYGKDIVCSAISSVVVGGLNGIKNIESFDVSIEKGYVKCILKANETISEHDKVVLETIRYQLLSIQEARSKNIQIREERIG